MPARNACSIIAGKIVTMSMRITVAAGTSTTINAEHAELA
jgi:hypothetical protein